MSDAGVRLGMSGSDVWVRLDRRGCGGIGLRMSGVWSNAACWRRVSSGVSSAGARLGLSDAGGKLGLSDAVVRLGSE